MNYIATFYTHASALMTDRSIKKAGAVSKLGPVPRELSSSCGTCVRYCAETPLLECMDADVETVYRIEPEGYTKLYHHE